MQTKMTKTIVLVTTLACCLTIQQTLAVDVGSTMRLHTYLKKACALCQSKPMKIIGATSLVGAGALALIIAKKHYNFQFSSLIHNRFINQTGEFLGNSFNNLRNFSLRGTISRATHAVSNILWPHYSLQQRVNTQVRGYRPADDTHLAHVPYFAENNNLIEEPVQFQNPHDHATVIVQQVRTAAQEIGGGETCGYECVKNPSAVAGLIKGFAGHHLLAPQAAEELFGVNPPGPLRQAITQARKRHALIESLINQLILPRNEIQPLQNETIAQVRNSYNDYRALLKRCLEEQMNRLEQTGQITLKASTIRKYLQQTKIPNIYKGDPDRSKEEIKNLHHARVAYLQNPANIARYIHIEHHVHLTQDDLDNAIANLNATREPNEQQPTNGENLDIGEIDQLFAQENANPQSIIGQMINGVQTITLAVPEEQAGNAFEMYEPLVAIRDAITNGNIQRLNRMYAIILRGSERGTRNNRHLISMVLDIAPHGSRRYTIIDSENNVQLFRGPAATCIRFLEGFKVQPPAARRHQIIESLENHATQCEGSVAELENELLTYRTSWGNPAKLPNNLHQRICHLSHDEEANEQEQEEGQNDAATS